jgi:restriction endonuclease-like protein
VNSTTASPDTPPTNPYRASTLAHLAEYKRSQLGVTTDGRWHHNNKPYPHLLPEDHRELNILPHIRDAFWAFATATGIPLHRDFHHLTSLQALAFNLFFPFRATAAEPRAALAEALGLTGVQVTDVRFDVVLDGDEQDKPGVVVDLATGLVVVDVKLTEDEFGKGKTDSTHRHKRGALYRQRLRGKVGASALDDAVFWSYYQLLRNISYASPKDGRYVILLIPRANAALTTSTQRFLSGFLEAEYRPWVRIVFLEDFLDHLQDLPGLPELAAHFRDVKAKYDIREVAS